jgi:hypothetical protein
VREDHAPLVAGESDFAFLNRCAWPAADAVRAVVQEWFQNYPTVEQKELAERLQSGDDRHFASAIFELTLHEYLIRLGMKLTPHPVLPNGSAKRPDFLVECPDGALLYLEAVGASEDTGANPAADAMKALTLKALDEAIHPDFILIVESQGNPTTQPSGKKLARAVHEWLDSLDQEAVRRAYQGNDLNAVETFPWEHEGWKIAIRPVIAKEPGQHTRMILSRSGGAFWVDTEGPIRAALTKKARRYGKLDLPLVVAINVDSFRLDPDDEVSSLFGSELYVVDRENPEAGARLTRANDGAWRDASGYKGTRASGAWFFDRLSPYSVAEARNRLYLHPAPQIAIPASFLVQPHAFAVDGRIQQVDGPSLGKVLGLPTGWPE